MTEIPNSFANVDWVTERAKCTAFTVFEVLRYQVQQDVERRNTLSAQLPAHKTFMFQTAGKSFSVVYKIFENEKGVTFRLAPCGVRACDAESDALLCDGILVISNDGQCRLRVKDVECDLWQFRKLALHDLFFVNQEIGL